MVKQKLKQAHDRYIQEILGLTDNLYQSQPNYQSNPKPHKNTFASKKIISLLKKQNRTPKALSPLKKDV